MSQSQGSTPGNPFCYVQANADADAQSVDWEVLSRTKESVDWEVVSCVDSVVSIGTDCSTYADILKRGNSQAGRSPVAQKTKRWTPQPTGSTTKRSGKNKVEDAAKRIFEFDAYFVMEGVKSTRGGRANQMFKGNPKTQKRPKKARA